MTEPALDDRDREVFEMWKRTALLHAKSPRFDRRLRQAREVIRRAYADEPTSAVGWSGGKDSTVLAHLVSVEQPGAAAFSEKDDLDFPGEREFVEKYAAEWSLRLTIVEPDVQPSAWLAEYGAELGAAADIHSRAAALSSACFYGAVERANRDVAGILLGLRKDESAGRLRLRASRGTVYRRKPTGDHPRGLQVALPLADWSGLDVLAYTFAFDLPMLDVYRCVGFMHANEPWRLRKSWWFPGSAARFGQAEWLRRYYPSLHQRMGEVCPQWRIL